MSDDTPTERLAEATEDLAEERRKSSVLMIVLIVVGALLLIGLIVLLVLLFTRPGDAPAPAPTTTETSSPTPTETPTPTESATPTPTPTPTPTAAPPPPPSVIVSYGASDSNVDCTDAGESIPVTFNWNTTGSQVSFGVQTDFADSQPYQSGLPPVGGITVDHQCSASGDQQKYSIAVFHNGQVIARQTLVVHD